MAVSAPPEPSPDRRHGTGAWRVITVIVWVGLVAELVVLATHALFGWWFSPPQNAATPPPLALRQAEPPSARAVLLALADVAARRPAAGPTRADPYAYVSRRTWALTAGTAVPTRVVPTVIQSWRRADGSGRILTERGDGPLQARTLPAAIGLPALSTRPGALGALLGIPGEATDDIDPFLALAGLADTRPIPAPVQAEALRLLASLPDLVNSGTVADRMGRVGDAISVVSGDAGPPIRDTIVLDPATGALLELDQTLQGDSGPLHAEQGAVVAYTTYLAAGYTANTMTAP